MRADRHEYRVEAPVAPLGVQVLHPVAAGDAHAQRGDPVKLAVQDVARHPVGRYAVPHHPARPLARVPYLHLVPEPGQVVGGGKPARPGADDQHPLAAVRGRRVKRPAALKREIAEEPLDTVNRNGAIEAGAVAGALAGVVTHPAVDRGHRIVADQLPPRPFMIPRLGVGQPGLDVLPGRAACVARRQQVDVDGTLLAHGARAGLAVQQIRQRRKVLSLWSQRHIRTLRRETVQHQGPSALGSLSSPG